MINNTALPLIFIGSNDNLHWIVHVARQVGYTIAGIIDDDYHGQGHFLGIPVIARLQELVDSPEKFNHYQFFCATNWQPDNLRDPYQQRNRLKRETLINIIETAKLNVATIISPKADVSTFKVNIGRGVFVDSFCLIVTDVTIGDYTTIYAHAAIGDNSVIGYNCVIQRNVVVTGHVTIKDYVYLAVCAQVLGHYTSIANGTYVHPGLLLMRSTQPHETISLAGKDLRRVYNKPKELNE
jgi:UDP-3-O-[3-hydroxymyristoyl] glucosamine N-acyltransferase